MAVVLLPRSLVALFPGVPRRVELDGPTTVDDVIGRLDVLWPGMRDRVCEAGPMLREHINVFVDRQPADLSTAVSTASEIHIIPAVSGG
jgi:molybdopterin synthase sulfur carrier subunit